MQSWAKDYKNVKARKWVTYKKVGIVQSPVLGGAEISFTKAGFNHLLRRGRKFRPLPEQMMCLSLLPRAKAIITDPAATVTYRKIKRKHADIHYWAFVGRLRNRGVRLIVRQIGAGQKHFYSIMRERRRNKNNLA